MVGRWLRLGIRLLILEEPTASVDVGAKAALYRLLDEALAAGLAVLLISSDFEEVTGVCRSRPGLRPRVRDGRAERSGPHRRRTHPGGLGPARLRNRGETDDHLPGSPRPG